MPNNLKYPSMSCSSQQVYYDANFLLYEPNQNFVDGILASSAPYSSIKAFREGIPTLLKVCLCIQDQLKFTFFIIWLRGSQAIIYMKWLPIAKGNFFAFKTFLGEDFQHSKYILIRRSKHSASGFFLCTHIEPNLIQF